MAELWPGAVVDDRLAADDLMAVAVHELAHRLDEPELFAPVADEAAAAELAAREADPCLRLLHFAAALGVDRPIADHSPTWCRLAMHQACRVEAVSGRWPGPRDVLAYPWLGPFVYRMQSVRDDEIDEWADRPLSWVKAQPLPSKLVDL